MMVNLFPDAYHQMRADVAIRLYGAMLSNEHHTWLEDLLPARAVRAAELILDELGLINPDSIEGA